MAVIMEKINAGTMGPLAANAAMEITNAKTVAKRVVKAVKPM
jgi:hypothetical protein